MARKLEVEIIGDARSYQRALGQADSSSSKFGRTLGTLGKAGALAAGTAGIGAVFVTLRSGISEFTEATKVAAQTEAVIKSTGGTANVTARHVDELASSVMRYSGIDDEAVKSGQNLLLTFKQVRNEVGRGNRVFDRATKAAVDLSVAGFGSIETTAKQLGKALNDPIRGMTALGRAGVTFTQAQREQIKSLVESNKTLEAQKLILKEVESQVGGSAKALGQTLPGQINLLKESFNNLAGDLVAKAVPAVTSFVGFLNEKGLPAIEKTFGRISEVVGPAIAALGETFKAAGPAIMGVLEPLGRTIAETLVPIFEQLREIGTRAMQEISAIIKDNGPQLREIFANLGQVISNLAKVVVPLLDFAFTKVLPVAIRVLIPLLVAVTEVMSKISTIVRVVAGVLTSILVGAFNLASGAAKALVNLYEKTLAPAFTALGEAAKITGGVLRAAFVPAFNAVGDAAGAVRVLFQWFADKAGAIWKKLAIVLVPAINAITAPILAMGGALDVVIGLFKAFIDKAGEVIDLAAKVGGAVGGLLGKIPGLAAGGPAEKGRAYIVGEKGPELFVPGSNGMIVPNLSSPGAVGMSAAPSGGVGSPVVVHIHGNLIASKREVEDLVRRALYDVGRRNPGALPA